MTYCEDYLCIQLRVNHYAWRGVCASSSPLTSTGLGLKSAPGSKNFSRKLSQKRKATSNLGPFLAYPCNISGLKSGGTISGGGVTRLPDAADSNSRKCLVHFQTKVSYRWKTFDSNLPGFVPILLWPRSRSRLGNRWQPRD